MRGSRKKLISVIFPVYNEEENIPSLCDAFAKVWEKLEDKYGYEIIFVNDGSNDGSAELIERMVAGNKGIKYLEFSRNFGKEIATSAGLHYAKGDAAIILDADLQHPVELIPEFVAKWENGAEMVVGIREKNEGEGVVKKFGSFLFYKIMNRVSDMKLIPCETDYRLVDRKVIDEFNRFTERLRMTRGLLNWLGFKRDYVYFEANGRSSGKAGYKTGKLVKLALSALVANSLFPLRVSGYLGGFITVLSGLFGLFILVERFVLGDPLSLSFSGPAILAVIILFLVGIILSCLGLMALYIANIHGEVENRPMYVIRRKKNI